MAVTLLAAALPALAAPAALAQTSAQAGAGGHLTQHASVHSVKAAPAATVPHAAAMKAAQAKAKATGKAVVVSADTTQTSQIKANPNGSFTSVLNVLPVRVRQSGKWVPISTKLVRGPHDTWHPAAATVQVRISGGGSGPLAVLSSPSGKQLTLWFPGRLPAPVIRGAAATYRSVRPGVDLQVSAGAYGSVTEQLTVHTHAALVSSWLRQLRLTYKAPGLRLATDKFGDVLAADPAGTIFTMSAPVTSVPVPRPQRPAARAGRPLASGPSQADTTAHATVAGQRIVLPASTQRLPTPIRYPVTISATFTADAAASAAPKTDTKADAETPSCIGAGSTCTPFNDPMDGFVEVQDVGQSTSTSCSGDKNWDGEAPGDVTELGIGYNAWSSCIGVYETFYIFGMGLIDSSAYIFENSTLTIPVVYSALDSCTSYSEPVNLSSLGRGAAGTFAGPNYDGANAVSLPGGYSTETEDTPPATSLDATCPARSVSFNVLSYMKTGQSEGAAFWNYGVSGNNATDGYGFMRLSDDPSLVTTFDEVPPVPVVDQSTPPMMVNPSTQSTNFGCTASDGIPWIGATTGSISLAATFSAALTGGENVMANYSAAWSGGSASYSTPEIPSGNVDSYALISSPVNGDEYTWSASTSVNLNNTGNTYTSGATSCNFAYDSTPPTTPVVSSSSFPPLGASPGTSQTAPGGSGTFNFSADDPPPSGCSSSNPVANTAATTCLASGVYQFDYSLNQPLSANPAPLGSGGAASCTSSSGAVPATNPTGNPETSSSANPSYATTGTSCAVTISQWGTNTLYVQAVDLAGNVSQSYMYQFYVPYNSSATAAPGDINGDGVPDLAATNGSGNLMLYSGADPGAAPQTVGTTATDPSLQPSVGGSSTWDQLQFAHRGSWSGGLVDDLVVLDQPDQDLFVYENNGTSPEFENTTKIINVVFPTCSGTDCSGYPPQLTGWGAFNQILVPGDVFGTPAEPSLLAVDATTGSLWLFQGTTVQQLENPIEIGTSGWNEVTLLAPGDVDGQLTLWARVNTGTEQGDILSFPLSPSSSLGTPTGSGTILDGSSGGPIQLPQSTYPLVTSPGAPGLSGGTCSAANTMACPAIYAVNTSGELVLFGGQPTTTQADALTGNDANVADVGTGLTQLS
jgi:hypothetical protein